MAPGGPWAQAQLLWFGFFFPPSLLEARHSNEKQNLKKSKTKQQKPLNLRLTCSLCSVSLLCFSLSVSKTKIVLMEQFKHTGQLLFNATFFFLFLTRTHATHTNRGVGGWISAERAHIWIDMLQFTGPTQDRGGKVLIFCQYGCVLILGPHSFSSLRCGGAGGGGVSHLFCQFPWQRGSSKSEEVRPLVRGESGFTEINIT